MKRIKLTVAYDGTNYHGWQIQPNAVTVEGELNKVISELTGEHIEVIGASRTDAGVHALGNVAVFDTESSDTGRKVFICAESKTSGRYNNTKFRRSGIRLSSALSGMQKNI